MLATEPRVLCLDSRRRDERRRDRGHGGAVRRIAADYTILIVEHDMEVVMGLARTITVLHCGEILAESTPAEKQANARVQEVYLKT